MSVSRFVFRGPLNVGVARSGHVDFICSAFLQSSKWYSFLLGSKLSPLVLLRCPNIVRFLFQPSGDKTFRAETMIRVRDYGYGRPIMPVLF